MKGTTIFQLFVILLGFSHLICLQAVPITRTENLMQDRPQVDVALPENIHNHKVTITGRKEGTISERMELELHDYPPSGANNRHTPRAP
ncbi:hypothetical protein SESBI_28625 [Sesbania bispinosa]|nr:hypothetical protein SESBI_28625 [Sesbania bispinosa]